MNIKFPEGLLVGATYVPSPNFNERPPKQIIDTLVIHNISLPPEEFDNDNVLAFFTNQLDHNQHPYFETIRGVQVSSHLYIRRNGEIVQFVPFSKRAWHAGESEFKGRRNCNDFSIGIELAGSDTTPFTPQQYESLSQIIQLLRQNYPIPQSNVVGHSDVAPTRKTDPGALFDWHHLNMLVDKLMVE
jgi:AmpD protein